MIYWYILVMAGVTYLIRVVPLVLFHKKIENRFVRRSCTMFRMPA